MKVLYGFQGLTQFQAIGVFQRLPHRKHWRSQYACASAHQIDSFLVLDFPHSLPYWNALTTKAELSNELRVWPAIYIAKPFLILVKFVGLNHVFGRPHPQLRQPSGTHIWLDFLVHDRSLLSFGTAWCSRLTRFVGARRLHLQGEENYSTCLLKFCLWGCQTLYSKFAEPVARRQHVARDTVLCYPRRHLECDKALHPPFLTKPKRNAGAILKALSCLIIQKCITILIHFVKMC